MRAEKRLPVSEKTKNYIDDEKPDGVTYDFLVRHAVRTMDPLERDS